jgi:hypothetical protein
MKFMGKRFGLFVVAGQGGTVQNMGCKNASL